LDPLNGPDLAYPGGREVLPAHPNLHYPMIKNFVDAFLDGTPLLASGASSIWTDWKGLAGAEGPEFQKLPYAAHAKSSIYH
jgi:hypothetical protein